MSAIKNHASASSDSRWKYFRPPPPLTEGSGGIPVVQFALGYEHVTFRAAGVGTVALLHDHNGISHVAVRKVKPEVGPDGHPPLASRHWATEASERLW